MSLDGLRAWIGVVERKLTMRTRVFLVLVALAIGGTGAAIYLAVEAQNDSVSEADLQAVRDELAGTAPEGAADTTQLQSELDALRSELDALRSEGEAEGDGGDAEEPGGGTSGGAAAPPSRQQLKAEGEKALEDARGK